MIKPTFVYSVSVCDSSADFNSHVFLKKTKIEKRSNMYIYMQVNSAAMADTTQGHLISAKDGTTRGILEAETRHLGLHIRLKSASKNTMSKISNSDHQK